MKKSLQKILIVDDEDALRDIYSTKLLREGFDVECACDGCEALQKIVHYIPQLILLDVVMPERAGIFDGFDVLRHIRNDHRMDDVRVVMMTNLGLKEDRERGKALGADEYLIKTNITPDDVVKIIEDILGVSRKKK